MDQIKKIMAVVAKYHFWLLSVLAVILCVAGWYLASSALTKKFADNKRTVEAQFSKLQTVASEAAHPNDDVNKGILAQTEQQRKRVYDVWRSLYDEQKKEVLFWPEALGKPFIQRIERLKFGAPLPQWMRERYNNYIKTRFEQLPQIVGASQESIASSARRMGRSVARGPIHGGSANGADVESEDTFKVHWRDYGTIEQNFVWEKTPASLTVWLTQEDLWVYETLLKIIAKTNESATGHHDAPIKEIQEIKVGQDAAAQRSATGKMWQPGQSIGGRGAGGSQGVPTEESRSAGGEDASDAEAAAKARTVRRYLDEQGQPIEEAPMGNDSSPFKRLPIYMKLVMDERELPRLLTECANATLPVEVKQVWIKPDAQIDAGQPRGNRGGPPSGEKGEAPDPAVVPVTLQGMIYIFNPPNRQLLGLPKEELPVADASARPADT